MFYLVQRGLYTSAHESKLIDALTKMGLDWSFFDLKYFVDEIEVNPPTDNVFVFGAVKASLLAKNRGWKPGSFYNENHDFLSYSEHYRENLLNWHSTIQRVSDPIPPHIGEDFFLRPTGDTKYFKGGIYNRKEWEDALEIAISNSPNPKEVSSSMMVLSEPKVIYAEYRFFIVKGQVITGSMYKRGGRLFFERCTESSVINYVNKMVEIYSPADAYVMDVCDTQDGFKIVEINCINCSGFYDIDIFTLLSSLEDSLFL